MWSSFFPRSKEDLFFLWLPTAKMRSHNWALKAKRRRTTGTGRMQYLKHVSRRFKNGFQTGVAKAQSTSD